MHVLSTGFPAFLLCLGPGKSTPRALAQRYKRQSIASSSAWPAPPVENSGDTCSPALVLGERVVRTIWIST